MLRQDALSRFKIGGNENLPAPNGVDQTTSSYDLGAIEYSSINGKELEDRSLARNLSSDYLLGLRIFADTLAVQTAFTRDVGLTLTVEDSADNVTFNKAFEVSNINVNDILTPSERRSTTILFPNNLRRYIRVKYQRGAAGAYVVGGTWVLGIVAMIEPSFSKAQGGM